MVGRMKKFEDGKLVRGWKSGRIEKIWFSLMCVWLEGWKNGGGKHFCLVGEKNGKIENVIYIN